VRVTDSNVDDGSINLRALAAGQRRRTDAGRTGAGIALAHPGSGSRHRGGLTEAADNVDALVLPDQQDDDQDDRAA
jgi:hypothetical protein